MISKIISFIIELFRSKPSRQKKLEDKVELLKDELADIEKEKLDDGDVDDYINSIDLKVGEDEQ